MRTWLATVAGMVTAIMVIYPVMAQELGYQECPELPEKIMSCEPYRCKVYKIGLPYNDSSLEIFGEEFGACAVQIVVRQPFMNMEVKRICQYSERSRQAMANVAKYALETGKDLKEGEDYHHLLGTVLTGECAMMH